MTFADALAEAGDALEEAVAHRIVQGLEIPPRPGSVVLMELRLGADTLPRRRGVDRIKAAFPAGRLIAPAPELQDAGRALAQDADAEV